jgi:hypothetical protein
VVVGSLWPDDAGLQIQHLGFDSNNENHCAHKYTAYNAIHPLDFKLINTTLSLKNGEVM